MKIKKAIFPVGGLGTRFLPATKSMPKEMLPVVDKPLVQYAVEEAANAGIEQFIFVTSRGKSAIENHFDHSFELENNLLSKGKRDTLKTAQEMLKIPGSFAYVRQQEPAGLGHAVWCARHLIGNEPVAILLADDLINGLNTTKEMINNYTSGNMLAIMDVDKKDVSSYGIITPGKSFENNISKLIIVTGKGLHSNNANDPYVSKNLSILKYSVPEFINNNASLMKMINEITDAKIEDGGGGAFYIFLKKNKSIK